MNIKDGLVMAVTVAPLVVGAMEVSAQPRHSSKGPSSSLDAKIQARNPDICFAIRYAKQLPDGGTHYTNIGGSSTYSSGEPHTFCLPYGEVSAHVKFSDFQLQQMVDKAAYGRPQRPISGRPDAKGVPVQWDSTFTPIGVMEAASGIAKYLKDTSSSDNINPMTFKITKTRTLHQLPFAVDGSVPDNGYAQFVFK